ncbi:MAG: hypothetical protein DRQ51_09550 [Gammaproteobacteria bacterium]|nr:MAG: hypothetical protein DRQ51_09550 [Gammaproteobacteria bacterium]
MLDILFNIFIQPIELLMQAILSLCFSITNNYGLSIILLSIIINILILPLYYLAEDLKNQDKIKLKSLQPQIAFYKKNFKGQQRQYYIQALYRVNNYHPLSAIKSSFGLLLQIPFFFAAFHLLGNYSAFDNISFGFIINLNQPDNLLFGLNILPILMTIINLSSAYFYTKKMDKSDKYQLWILSIVFLVLLYAEPAALLLYWTINNAFSFIKNTIESKFNIDKFKNLSVAFIKKPAIIISNIYQLSIIQKTIKSNFIQATVLFFGTVFIYQAIPMAASDTSIYFAPYPQVAGVLIALFLASIIILTLFYLILPKKLKTFLTIIITFFALSGLWFAFINPVDIGHLTGLQIPDFTKTERLQRQIVYIIMFFSLVAFFYTYRRLKNCILWIFIIANLILMGQSIVGGLSPKAIDMITSNTPDFAKKQQQHLIDRFKTAFAFSTESNVIVIMMDMFQGNLFADIIEKHPALKQQLTGFTYYPNTLSHSSLTSTSIAALVGGQEFQVQNLAKKSKISLEEEIHRAYKKNLSVAQKYNWRYTAIKPQYGNCKIFESYADGDCIFNDNILSQKMTDKKESFIKNKNTEILKTVKVFAKLSFILSAPHPIKLRLKHRFSESDAPILKHFFYNIYESARLQNMTTYANAKSDQKTFKLVQNNFTHWYWMSDENCNIVYKNFDNYQGFFNTSHCALKLLIKFFDKLKTLNIYHNTKIIITSDHGQRKIHTKNYNLPGDNKPSSSALMLVKDFNAAGDLKTSMNFLSNMDTYAITLSGVSAGKEVSQDPIKTPIQNRTLTYIDKIKGKVSYDILKMYEVKNNMFNPKNWQEIKH